MREKLVCAGRTDRQSDSLSSWRSQKPLEGLVSKDRQWAAVNRSSASLGGISQSRKDLCKVKTASVSSYPYCQSSNFQQPEQGKADSTFEQTQTFTVTESCFGNKHKNKILSLPTIISLVLYSTALKSCLEKLQNLILLSRSREERISFEFHLFAKLN